MRVRNFFCGWGWFIGCVLADNTLSFVETSALDSTNVELAFQKILTGLIFLLNIAVADSVLFFVVRDLPNRVKQGFGISSTG